MFNIPKIWKLALAIGVQAAIIGVIIIYKTAVLSSGNYVLLEIASVDTSDMANRGHVKVSYKISNVSYYDYTSPYLSNPLPQSGSYGMPSSELAPAPDLVPRSYPTPASGIQNGDTVYVPLSKYGKFWDNYGTVTKTKPQVNSNVSGRCSGLYQRCYDDYGSYGGSDYFYLKGVVLSGAGSSEQNPYNGQYPSYNSSYKHLNVVYGIEDYYSNSSNYSKVDLQKGGNNYAKVLVKDDGTPVLKKLYINDKPWP